MAEGARTESVYTATYRGSNPPHRHIRDESLYASTGSFLLYSPLGDENPDRGSTTGNASWTDREPASGLPQGERSESIPLTAIFEMRACTQVRALFFIFSTGDENPDRGSTTGNASWTDREPASGLPRQKRRERFEQRLRWSRRARPMDGPSNGERSESIPLTAIF